MEITESHIEFAKRELKKHNSIPGVAGSLLHRTPEEAEFSDLIAIANQAKIQLENEDTTDEIDTSLDAQSTKQTESLDNTTEDPASAPGTHPNTEQPAPPDPTDIDGIASESDNSGVSSWKK